jgi:HSP20 family protein
MTLVRRPSPFSELFTLRQAMDRLFDEPYLRPFDARFGALPLDVRTTADALEVEAALPGVDPEAVDITVENGTLTIRADSSREREDGEGEYLVRELSRGSFLRTISLPSGLEPDKAEATFEHGVLKLRLPKAEQVKPRQIRISPTSGATTRVVGSSDQSGEPAATSES